MDNKTSAIRVRFAPSPTGHLHIGGLRTALFNWLFARHMGGTYLMRIEDTDTLRSTKEYLASQLASLKWAGIMPDEAIVYQMGRVEEHKKAAYQLINEGKAYPCFCQPRDADEVVHELEQGIGKKYDGTCREKEVHAADLEKPHAIRYKLPSSIQEVKFFDLIRGEVVIKADYFDDFIIMRRDGSPVYNFCVVLDDIFMRISHVIRGEDHIPNTTKQILLYQALGAPLPAFAHLPLILGKDGSKLSKRDASVSVEEYRMEGFLPDALINYLVRLGWSHGDQEIFSREELVSCFTLEKVGKKGCVFDIKKLEWLNGVYLRQAGPEELIKSLEQVDQTLVSSLRKAWDEEQLRLLLSAYKDRSTTLIGLHQQVLALAYDPKQYDLTLIVKWQNAKTKKMLKEFVSAVHELHLFHHDELLHVAEQIALNHEEKLVHIAQVLRLALTGTLQSPSVFDLIGILGKTRALKRIEALLENL